VVSCLGQNFGPGNWSIADCTFTFQGNTLNFASLRKSPSWSWTQTMYVQDPANTANGGANTLANYTFELNICANVKSKFPSVCTTDSPINWLTGGNTACTPLGDLRVAAMDAVPYRDGVVLTYFHGAPYDHIHEHYARVYLICASTLQSPTLEHQKTDNQWHFRIGTPLACY